MHLLREAGDEGLDLFDGLAVGRDQIFLEVLALHSFEVGFHLFGVVVAVLWFHVVGGFGLH